MSGWVPHGVPRHYGIRTERYKLIHYYATDEWELFDLVEDPHELRSVRETPGYASVGTNSKPRCDACSNTTGCLRRTSSRRTRGSVFVAAD